MAPARPAYPHALCGADLGVACQVPQFQSRSPDPGSRCAHRAVAQLRRLGPGGTDQLIGTCRGSAMRLPIGLGEHLEALSAALDDPATDLHAILAVLSDDVIAAVPRSSGWS